MIAVEKENAPAALKAFMENPLADILGSKRQAVLNEILKHLWPVQRPISTKALNALIWKHDLLDKPKIKKAILAGEIAPKVVPKYGKRCHAYVCEAVGIPYYVKPRVTWGCPCCGHTGKLSDFKIETTNDNT